MTKKKRKLPDYDKPPVSEVVIGIQYDSLDKFDPVHTGIYWQQIREKYPKFETHPPLTANMEYFEENKPSVPEFAFSPVPPLPRSWFLNETETRLVQLQNTHFFHNWRKITGDEGYPRFTRICKEFIKLWEDFLIFVSNQNIGNVKPNHWEVTYVNHINKGEGWESAKDFTNIFPVWSGKTSENYLPEPEKVSFRVNYCFPEERARLHITAEPAIKRRDQSEVIRLNLTARGRIDSSETQDILACVDKGHEWIVRGFTDFTSQEAHKLWRRKDK